MQHDHLTRAKSKSLKVLDQTTASYYCRSLFFSTHWFVSRNSVRYTLYAVRTSGFLNINADLDASDLNDAGLGRGGILLQLQTKQLALQVVMVLIDRL